jgi:DNA-directed RNA polymerase subunit RPC12/RpoP
MPLMHQGKAQEDVRRRLEMQDLRPHILRRNAHKSALTQGGGGMTYVCIECGTEFDYEDLLKNKMKCNACSVKRNNIWIKKRKDSMLKTIIAR